MSPPLRACPTPARRATRRLPLVLLLPLLLAACGGALPLAAPLPEPQQEPEPEPEPEPDLIEVPAGTFRMGDLAGNGAADELPVRDVAVQAFRLGRHEVTIGEFRRFVAATGYRTDAEREIGRPGCYGRRAPEGAPWETGRGWLVGLDWESPGYPVSDRHPVACVSWNDAQAYLEWLGRRLGRRFRLPTEAEWEYAARAGSRAIYPWGDDPDEGCRWANGRDLTPWPDGGRWNLPMRCEDGHFAPAPVGSYAPNAFGLREMTGNLSEWVADCRHDDYAGAPLDGSARTDGDCSARMVRGGTFVYGPSGLRVANRVWNEPAYRVWYQGFRVAEPR